MATIKPFRDYDEHDVIGVFSYDGTYPVNKGTFVKINVGFSGVNNLAIAGSPGSSYNNVTSPRWKIPATVTATTASGDSVIGMLLYDGKETDENSEKLVFDPEKARQLNVFISGQAAPIVTRGIFLFSGIGGAPAAGNPAYLSGDGSIFTMAATTATRVGTFLGPKDDQGFALIKLNLAY